MFQELQTSEVAGIEFHTLILDEVPWVTPYCNRIGRFDFERFLGDHKGSGIWAYVHTEGDKKFLRDKRCQCVTVLLSNIRGLNAIDLVTEGARAFGGLRYGATGGRTRAEGCGTSMGDAEDAFAQIATRIREFAGDGLSD